MRLLLWCALSGAAFAQTPITFLHISDTHVSQIEAAHPKLREWRDRHGETVAHLRQFLGSTVKQQGAAFVVASGDLTDAWCFDAPPPAPPIHGQVELFRSIVTSSPVPFYPTLGNHDIECYRYQEGVEEPVGDQSVQAETRETWQQNLEVFHGGTYYSFRRRVGQTVYRFLMLDNGDNKQPNPAYRAKQLEWVKQEAASSDRVIFVMHIPLGKNGFTDLLRTAASGSRAVLALAGHNHRDELDEVAFGDQPLPQVRTASMGNSATKWRAIRLFEDRIEVTETGNSAKTLRTVPVRIATLH